MPKTAVKKKSIYGVHPGVHNHEVGGRLKTKTGRSLDEWIKFIRKEGPPTEQARDWLKQEHGWEQTSLVDGGRSVGKGERPVTDVSAGRRNTLMNVCRQEASASDLTRCWVGLSMGKDRPVCQTIVPLYRNHVFAQIKPTTGRDRLLVWRGIQRRQAFDRHRRLRKKIQSHIVSK
jgi:hypothetical protein